MHSTWLFLHEQMLIFVFAKLQQAHCKNLEMWLDGSNYSINSSRKHLRFLYFRSLLEFVGEGQNELLGYAKSLSRSMIDLR